MGRIASAGEALSRAAGFLSAQWAFTGERAPGQLAQVRAIAEGCGIKAQDLFAYLHLGLIFQDFPDWHGRCVYLHQENSRVVSRDVV